MLIKPKNRSVTLFFIVSAVATAFEEAQIEKLRAKPRCATAYSPDDTIEKADFLAGAVPAGLAARMRAAGYPVEVIPQEAEPVAEVAAIETGSAGSAENPAIVANSEAGATATTEQAPVAPIPPTPKPKLAPDPKAGLVAKGKKQKLK